VKLKDLLIVVAIFVVGALVFGASVHRVVGSGAPEPSWETVPVRLSQNLYRVECPGGWLYCYGESIAFVPSEPRPRRITIMQEKQNGPTYFSSEDPEKK